MVQQAVKHWRNGKQSGYWTEICEVLYSGFMLSKTGKVQELNRTKVKSVSGI
jgi:hypothetical protein